MKQKQQMQTVSVDKIIIVEYWLSRLLLWGETCSVSVLHKILSVCDRAACVVTGRAAHIKHAAHICLPCKQIYLVKPFYSMSHFTYSYSK